MKYSREALNFMVNHVILPPKLPQSDDTGSGYELALIQFVRDHSVAFQINLPAEYQDCWTRITKMLNTWIEVNEHGSISPEALLLATDALGYKGTYHLLLSNTISILKLTSFR